jgi:hypothetical protein
MAYERHAYEMTPARGTAMRWPMRGARLWGGLCGKYAYERRAYEMATYERYAYEMAPVRSMPMRDAPMRDTPMG